MDVSNEAQVEAGVDQVAQHFAAIDILVSNAGIQIVGPLESFKFSDWKTLLAVHLDGAFLTTRACLKHMRRVQARSFTWAPSTPKKHLCSSRLT